MKQPPSDLAQRLLDVSESVFTGDPAPRLEDVAKLVGASRATLYYYFAGRDDLLAFLLTEHARHGAEAIAAAVDPADPPATRLRASVAALIAYLARYPGTCGGLLVAAGRMDEAMASTDHWIAAPLRDLLAGGDPADRVNAMLGGIVFAVFGRARTGADPTDRGFQRRLTDQIVAGS